MMLSSRRFRVVYLAIAFVGANCCHAFGQTPAAAPVQINAQQVISFLNQTIDWYRHLGVEEQIASDPTDVLFVNDDRQMANQIVRQSFDFARAAAQNASTQSSEAPAQTPANSRFQSLMQASTQADTTLRETQAEVDQLRDKYAKATARDRQKLQSTLDETEAELALAKARSDALHNMLQFVNTGSAGSGNLLSQVQELQRSVPEAAPEASEQGAKTGAQPGTSNNSSATSRREQPSGLLALFTDLFSLTRKIHTLDETLTTTDSLAQTSAALRAPLGKALQAAVQRGNQIAQQADTSDAAGLEQEKRELDQLTTQFKQLSAMLLPLGKQSVIFDLYHSSLTRWRDELKQQYRFELKNLGVRLIVLTVIVGVFLILSEVWKRATFRYVHDFRRRYQFLLLRRILLWFVIAITVAFALATEIGSLATFAGLITAGIAVALQNVILAVAGYFFLIGRYGVRVGDRVQISGITGDVIDIGLVRLHLMELGGSGNSMQPTGRVVVFSNSILFQPTASFYKQIPGTNFVWHEVSLTLAPESDIHLAESRLLSAVQKVYSAYKERIEQEHRHMQKTLNIRSSVPAPVSRLRLTQSGLEVIIRYPVELDRSAEIDDQITRELLATLKQEPRLRLVGSGTPNIQTVTGTDVSEPEPVIATAGHETPNEHHHG